MAEQTKSKGLLKKMLFLELTGFVSLALAATAMILLFSLNLVKSSQLIIPVAGFLVLFLFIALSVRYARRDLHKIHELHSTRFYHLGRILVYVIGLGMIGYAFYELISSKELSVGDIIELEIVLALGILVLYYTFMIGYLIDNEHMRHEHANFWDYFWVIIFPVLLIGGTAYMLFNQPAETVSKGKADFEMTPVSLVKEFQKNDSNANKKYHDKIILLASHVVEISGDSSMLVKLDGGVEGVTINCGFDKSMKEKLAGIVVGDSVQVQCSCSAFVKPDSETSLLAETYIDMARCNLIKHVPLKANVGTDIESPVKGDSATKK